MPLRKSRITRLNNLQKAREARHAAKNKNEVPEPSHDANLGVATSAFRSAQIQANSNIIEAIKSNDICTSNRNLELVSNNNNEVPEPFHDGNFNVATSSQYKNAYLPYPSNTITSPTFVAQKMPIRKIFDDTEPTSKKRSFLPNQPAQYTKSNHSPKRRKVERDQYSENFPEPSTSNDIGAFIRNIEKISNNFLEANKSNDIWASNKNVETVSNNNFPEPSTSSDIGAFNRNLETISIIHCYSPVQQEM